MIRSKIKQALLITIAAAGLSIGLLSASNDGDFNAIKNLDLFFSAFRELKVFYVDEIDADKLVPKAINSMLEELDPYTEFMTEEQAKEFDVATTGEYGGIGSLVRTSGDYTEISEVYQGFPADKAGLVSGDLLLAIDGVSLYKKNVSDVSEMLKGAKGTSIKLKVLKIKTNDTVNLSLKRERIHISGITYADVLSNGVGYIRLSSFTQGCSKDFKNAFEELKKTGKLESLVIDLRGNGGGLVDDAVKIMSLFVPKGTEVVSSKGRVSDFDYVYKTESEPLDTKIPIAVLVNSGSASSSEILTGAIQDLDRGIIIGTRTFGKGLVQSVRPLSYNAKIKITSAKYYTPSGRCVQAHNFSKRNEDGSVAFIPDSLKREFRTKVGRPVFDGGGILPDIVDSAQDYSNIATSLIYSGLVSDFSVQYHLKHPSIAQPEVFRLTDEDYQDFIAFLEGKDYDYQTKSESLAKQLIAAVSKEKHDEAVVEQLRQLTKQLEHDKKMDLLNYKDEIKRMLEDEIAVRYYYQAGRIRSILKDDQQLMKAKEYLTSPEKYKATLTPKG